MQRCLVANTFLSTPAGPGPEERNRHSREGSFGVEHRVSSHNRNVTVGLAGGYRTLLSNASSAYVQDEEKAAADYPAKSRGADKVRTESCCCGAMRATRDGTLQNFVKAER